MRHNLLLAIISASALSLGGMLYPTAWADTRAYSLSDFSSVSASASVRVVLKQGPYAVNAESTDGKFDELDIHTEGRKLMIGRKSHMRFGPGPHYTVTVSAPAYDGISASSSARLSGAGLSLKQVDVSASSSGRVELAGSCQSLSAHVSSSGRFDGSELKCEAADIDASSSARAEVFAAKAVTGRASSSAKIEVLGKPAQFDKHTSSSGSISQR